MRRIMLTVAYDGTGYCGWQVQPDEPTVEAVLAGELSRLLGEDIKVIGASRTDAGVHAEGAVAVFDTSSSIPGDKFSYALNRSLPDDIVIRRSEEVAADFHPRKVNCRKTYRYSIWHDTFPMPMKCRYATWIHYPLDVEAMRQAAQCFVGEHDFAGFCSAAADVDSTVRTIYDMKIVAPERSFEKKIPLSDGKCTHVKYFGPIDIYVTGSGFLYNMVRIIAGTLIDVGCNKIEASLVPDIIRSCSRSRAGNTAPAKGLTLIGFEFDPNDLYGHNTP
ncbi:MAG: tRNA pseudouridine(38-40) synthase TruA [Lachnospiraceae bacterium]|nr:tRNA pseudouridine(38-40) synthase TruA [Lachnospiraceae bacterium]